MRLTILVLLLLLLAPRGNCIASKPDETPGRGAAGEAAPVSVPFELYDPYVLVPVRVNGSAPLSFILDSGLNRTLVNPKLGLKGKRATLQIGGALLENVEILVPSFFDDLEAAFGRHVDGMFGSDLFQRFVVEIDYASHTVSLYNPKSYHYTGTEQRIPIRIKDHLPFVQCQIMPNAGEPLAGDFELDTGSDAALGLNGAFTQRHRLLDSAGPTISIWFWTAAAGQQENRTGRMKAFRVGRFTLDNPIVDFPTTSKGNFGLRPDYAGLLGAEILQRFKLILDYTHKWVIVEPNARLAEPFEADMSGMQLDMDADFSVYVVSGVRAQSPADEAGLKKGDVVIAIDGKPMATLRPREIYRMFKQEGREFRLQIRRDKQNLEVKLKLRRLI